MGFCGMSGMTQGVNMPNRSISIRIGLILFLLLNSLGAVRAVSARGAQQAEGDLPLVLTTGYYNTGSPVYTDIWVDPTSGDDIHNTGTAASPFRTLARAWQSIPNTNPLTHAVRINLQPGTYTTAMIPNYWENKYGTYNAPILIRGNGTTRQQVLLTDTVNMYNVHYVYFDNLKIALGGDVFHCELCDHILLRNLILSGGTQQAQETIKVNQSKYIYIEKSDVSGAWDNAIDFVAVQYGHILSNQLHDAGDWCAYVKGGSAYIRVEANSIYDCGTGGFTAGQGTGFQFMVSPWLQYEAYDIKVVNNIIHDTAGAGLGVNGGYDILMAYNTLYRVGSRSHVLEVVFGGRSCDGNPGDPGRTRCQDYLNAGGWGTTVVDDGSNNIRIPNKNVYIYNNVIYNPAGFQSQWQHFAIYGPYSNPIASGVPDPARTDDNLKIRGNLIWNGDASMPLGIEGGEACMDANPSCNEAQLRADNSINALQPRFVSPSLSNYRPVGGWVTGSTTYPIPNFPTWEIPSVPAGTIANSIPIDYENSARVAGNPPGAFSTRVPAVLSIQSLNASPTNLSSVNYKVTFSDVVSGVDGTDFSLTVSGITGASVGLVSGSGATRLVNVRTGQGTGTLRLDVLDDDSIRDGANHPLGGTGTTNGRFVSAPTYTLNRTIKSYSSALLDGWVLESARTSSIGGSRNAIAYLLVGDDLANKQYQSLLSFDTSALPDTATVVKVTLRVKKASVTGTDPFSTHGQLKVDIRKGYFGNSQALELADFQALPGLLNAGTFTAQAGGWYQAVLIPTALVRINIAGITQFRLHFTSADNNDNGADTLNLFAGEAAAISQPVLLVEYVMP